jgi:ABC-type multidrug transport system ATPase subunit
MMHVLGLKDIGNTIVGDGMLRGVSGGQKRRVTVGEMAVAPRPIKFMDAVSNGLDAATTYDIFRAFRLFVNTIGVTMVTSLLQVHIYTVYFY